MKAKKAVSSNTMQGSAAKGGGIKPASEPTPDSALRNTQRSKHQGKLLGRLDNPTTTKIAAKCRGALRNHHRCSASPSETMHALMSFCSGKTFVVDGGAPSLVDLFTEGTTLGESRLSAGGLAENGRTRSAYDHGLHKGIQSARGWGGGLRECWAGGMHVWLAQATPSEIRYNHKTVDAMM